MPNGIAKRAVNMIKIMKCSEVETDEILHRGQTGASEEIFASVNEILLDVKMNKDSAVRKYTEKFDGVLVGNLRVSEEEIDSAFNSADSEFILSLKKAAANIEDFHKRQIRENFIVNEKDGVILGQKVMPVQRAGIYVPGGTARYPSSVLMNAIPAKLAGVSEIIMITPPNKDGNVPPEILTAAKIAGVTHIIKTGGAHGIAALAYGTQSVPKVDKIVGPGNIYVATAKQLVFGMVDIDMIAGPSEILVIADATANPAYVAADMLSQAEHDKMATAVLVCDSEKLAQQVAQELERQIPLLERHEIARASIDNNGKIIIADDLMQGIDISNEIAPEHLEICVDEPFNYLNDIKNAGSIFLGKNVPEALGDYFAGPNHTLPTNGTAKFSSPLSVDDFVKKSSFIYYTKSALENVKDDVVRLAESEGLTAHAKSVSIRFEEGAK